MGELTAAHVRGGADVFIADSPRRYAKMPEWILDSDVSAQAIRLWCVLYRYADQSTKLAHPSRATLADRLQVRDRKVVDRALADLDRIGAVETFGRWRNMSDEIAFKPDLEYRIRTSNGYRLNLWRNL